MLNGLDISKLRGVGNQYELQVRDGQRQWRTWERIGPNGMKIGRSPNSPQLSGLDSLAVRHLKLSYEGRELVVEDLGSLNGVYVRVLKGTELAPGTKFRLGAFVVEFNAAPEPAGEVALKGEDGEEFWSAAPAPLAFLDFIGPDGQVRMRFPITKANDRTILGRENRRDKPVDVVLGDSSISAWHAMIRHENGRFFVEDLGSTNGTFVKVGPKHTLRPNDEMLVGQLLLKVVSVDSLLG